VLTPLPTIPTDSFYKFKAMAGIWLVVGSIGGASVALFKYQNEWYDARLRAASLQVESAALRREFDHDSRLVSDAEKLAKEMTRAEEVMSRALAEIEAIPNLGSIEKEELDDAKRRIAVIRRQSAAYAEMKRQIEAQLTILRKRSDEHIVASSSVDLGMLRLRVYVDRFKFLSTGFIVTMTTLAPLFVCGLWLARSGLREWRDLQSEQDAFLRRQWSEALPPQTSPASPALPSSPVPPT
jgi:hypothetical protein